MDLVAGIFDIARSEPERPAITDQFGTHSYRRLAETVSAYTCALEELPRERPVAALLDPRAEFVALYLAAFRANRMLVPLNDRLSRYELVDLVADAAPGAIVTERRHLERAGRLAQACQYDISVQAIEDIPPRAIGSCGESLPPEAQVTCFYTAGVQGTPKGAVLTLGSITYTVEALESVVCAQPHDVFLCVTPLWHVYSIVVACLLPLRLGARTVLCPLPTAVEVAHLLACERVTFIVGLPSLIARLASYLGEVHAPALRECVSGGDVLDASVRQAFESRFGIPITEGYGLTESTGVATCNPFGERRRPGSVGLPLPRERVLLVDDRDRQVPVGDVGEIILNGPNVMVGYLGRPEETLEALRGGWLYTGDLGRFDAQGYLHVVGRKKDLLVVDGLSVYPQQVEDVIMRLDGVAECCVIGVRDPVSGQVPKAVVVPEPGFSLDQHALRAHCEAHLAEYKVPRSFAFTTALPRTTAGRLSRATATLIYGKSLD